ncbi:MAG: hypothetical protein ACOYOA_11500 [Saprospiraceae bacterium]
MNVRNPIAAFCFFIFLSNCKSQVLNYKLSQKDINFIYSEAISTLLIKNSANLDLCCLDDFLKKYDEVEVDILDTLFEINFKSFGITDNQYRYLEPNNQLINKAKFKKITYNIQNPFQIVVKRFDKKNIATNEYVLIQFSNIIQYENKMYLGLRYSYKFPYDKKSEKFDASLIYELKVCFGKIIYFNKLYLGYEAKNSIDLNPYFCK